MMCHLKVVVAQIHGVNYLGTYSKPSNCRVGESNDSQPIGHTELLWVPGDRYIRPPSHTKRENSRWPDGSLSTSNALWPQYLRLPLCNTGRLVPIWQDHRHFSRHHRMHAIDLVEGRLSLYYSNIYDVGSSRHGGTADIEHRQPTRLPLHITYQRFSCSADQHAIVI